ncbi:hypothetical protein BCS42_03760 [Crenothrix sp. D3]|nr:hypothetical protein BCS42_03760 [Crenothrix sp. D3]
MNSQEINYEVWATYHSLDAFNASALWCNKNPYLFDQWSDLEFIEVRNLALHLIGHCLRAENYPEDKLMFSIMELVKRFDKGRFEYTEESRKYIIARNRLKEIAEKIGVMPKFLAFNSIKVEQPTNNPVHYPHLFS